MINFVLFGPPGSGKGTQAALLEEQFNLKHISTGDIFRYNIKNETELGKLAKSYIDKGALVPDEVTIDMLKQAVADNAEVKGFIFDGFPRTDIQAEALDAFLSGLETQINACLSLEVSDELLTERLLERGKTSGRSDDTDLSVIRDRIAVYHNQTAPLKHYYQHQDKFVAVDGVGAISEITHRLAEHIRKHI